MLNGDISKLLIIRGPKTLPEAYAICLELQNVTSKAHVSYNNRFPSPHQAYRPPFVPRYPWGFQPNQLADNQASPQMQQPSHRFSTPRPAIKMESNQSGQSYRSNVSTQSHGNLSFKRSPSTSSSLNPFRKAQRLYHLNTVPSPLGPATREYDEKSNGETYYEEAYRGSAATLPNCPLQADDQLRPEGEFGNTDEINFMTDASLAFHT